MIIPLNPAPDIAVAIQAATEYLEQFDLSYGHGTSDAIDDATWLVLEAAGLSPLLEPDYQQVLSATAVEKAESFLRQRAEQRLPAAYIVGRTWFAGLEIAVDSRVLVPRSPIAEFLLEEGFGLVEPERVNRVLDLCTGSGCIALAAACAFPGASVDACDLSDSALELARINIERHQLDERVSTFCGDLFAPVKGPYDLIISNPPYVDAEDMSGRSAEFRHEPAMGLAAGGDGLDVVHRILAEASAYLAPEGALICEVGNSAPALMNAYPGLPFTWLEFASGGEGVFYLPASALAAPASAS